MVLNVSEEGTVEDALATMLAEAHSLWFTRDFQKHLDLFPSLDVTRMNAMPLASAAYTLLDKLRVDRESLVAIWSMLQLAGELKIMAAVHYARLLEAGIVEPLPFDEVEQGEAT